MTDVDLRAWFPRPAFLVLTRRYSLLRSLRCDGHLRFGVWAESNPPQSRVSLQSRVLTPWQVMDGDFAAAFVRQPGALRDHPALVLNADYRPLSYFPLSLWAWQDAIKAAFLDRVSIVAEYETKVHSPSIAMKLPPLCRASTKNYWR